MVYYMVESHVAENYDQRWGQHLVRDRNVKNILKQLAEGAKRPKDILSALKSDEKTKMSEATFYKIVKELKAKKLITKKTSENGEEIYELTTKGKETYNGTWFLIHKLLELKEEGAGYIHTSMDFGIESDWISERTGKSNPQRIFSPALSEYKSFIINSIVKQIDPTKAIEPFDAKEIFAFELDFRQISELISKVQIFMGAVIKNEDVFLNRILFPVNSERDIETFYWYAHLAYFFNYVQFEKAFLRYVSDKANQKKLFSGIDLKIVYAIIDEIKQGKDPLDDTNLLKRLVYKDKKVAGVVWNFFPRYALAVELLTLNNKELLANVQKFKIEINGPSSRLTEYIISLHHKIHKNPKEGYKKEANGIFRCKKCGTGFSTFEQYETHNCIP